MPSFSSCMCFFFFFPTVVVGPTIEFYEFDDFLNLRSIYNKISFLGCLYHSLKELLKTAVAAYFWIYLKFFFDYNKCGSPEFGDLSFFYQTVFFTIALTVNQVKYFIAWKFSSSTFMMTGLGYRTYSNERKHILEDHHNFQNVNIRKIWLNPNPKVKLQFWNRNIHLWLRNYVFTRWLPPKDSKRGTGLASLITFLVSALWHGIYPSYYIFFVCCFFLEQTLDSLKTVGFIDKLENGYIWPQAVK